MEKKTYTTSNNTKHALAAALKTLMAQKPFEKITINEITELCGMRRQNFYYHFLDVYELLRWMFDEEAISLLRRHEGMLLWQDGLLQLFQYIEENHAVCYCALKSLGREHIKRFFASDIYDIIHHTIEQIGMDIGILDKKITKADIDLLTHFYVVSLVGIMESWLLGEIERTPQELVSFADQLLQDHVRGAKMRLQENTATI